MKPYQLAERYPLRQKFLIGFMKSHKSPLWWLGVRTPGTSWPATLLHAEDDIYRR